MRNLTSTIALIITLTTAAFTQTTIFNAPSADTLQKGSVNLEGDIVAKPASYANGGYQSYGYRLAYGLTNKTEVGSNFYLTRDGSRSVADVEFSLKRRVYQNEKLGISAGGGA